MHTFLVEKDGPGGCRETPLIGTSRHQTCCPGRTTFLTAPVPGPGNFVVSTTQGCQWSRDGPERVLNPAGRRAENLSGGPPRSAVALCPGLRSRPPGGWGRRAQRRRRFRPSLGPAAACQASPARHPLQGTPKIDARKADERLSVAPTVISAKPKSCFVPRQHPSHTAAFAPCQPMPDNGSFVVSSSSPHPAPAPKDWSSS